VVLIGKVKTFLRAGQEALPEVNDRLGRIIPFLETKDENLGPSSGVCLAPDGQLLAINPRTVPVLSRGVAAPAGDMVRPRESLAGIRSPQACPELTLMGPGFGPGQFMTKDREMSDQFASVTGDHHGDDQDHRFWSADSAHRPQDRSDEGVPVHNRSILCVPWASKRGSAHARSTQGPLLSSNDRRALALCVVFGMIVWVVVLGLVVPRLDGRGHPTHDIPADVANLLDAANLSSVHLGEKCVATSMQLERVVALLDGDQRWAFRWDEKMVTKTGFVAAILDHQGAESYLLTFSFAGTKTAGEARLVRIAAGNPDAGPHELGCL
jgi:hypothetical protein